MDFTHSFQTLLLTFSPVFTAPSCETSFVDDRVDRLAATSLVTDLIISSDSVTTVTFPTTTASARLSGRIDQLWKLLAKLIVSTLVGKDAILCLAGDVTLCRKRGLGIFGTGMH